MKKTGLFYWPKRGNVETCALKIKEQFEEGSGFTFQSKCILFPPLLLPIAVYLYNDEHKHKKIEGNKNV